jgi:hypothetical protein
MCFERLLGVTGQLCEDKVAIIMNLLCALMSEYHVEEVEDTTISSTMSVGNLEFLSSFSARVASTSPKSMNLKPELDRYLEDGFVPLDSKGFNVLEW